MSDLFNPIKAGPNANQIASNLIQQSNMTYMRLRDSLVRDFEQFWFRNRDNNGNRALEGAKPTGIEILQALGTQAAPLMAIAWARVQFVAACSEVAGQPFDSTELIPPYDLTWNEDGSLADATLRE